MRELPTQPLQTLFALRQFAAFMDVDLAELAVVADNVREIRFAAGAEIAAGDTRLAAFQLVLDGRIEVRSGDAISSWGPRDVFGLLEVLANRAVTAPAISAVETRTLQLGAVDAIEILEDNFGVLHSVIRALVARLAASGGKLDAVAIPSSTRLTLVERLIVLRQLAPFAGGRLHALAAFAQSCEEVELPVGASLTRAKQRADGFAIVLDGDAHVLHRDHRDPQLLRVGDPVGLLEAIGGGYHTADVVTASQVRVLRCPTAALIDVLEDHTDLGLSIVNNVATRLLDGRTVERDLHDHLS